MGLPVPTSGITSGPQYATDINDSLNIIDQHDHSTGSGVPITPNGLSINADLPINDNNLTLVRSTRFKVQPSTLALSTDVNCLYVSGVDLYYNDGTNTIRITTGGSVNAGAGSIGGLPSGTASANFSSGSFAFQSSTNVGADIDGRNHIFRNNVASSAALVLTPPAAMASDYVLVLPPLPVSQKIMTLDASGNITAPYVVDNSTIEVSTNTIQVKNLGITTAKIADNAITSSKLVNTNLTISAATIISGTLNLTGAITVTNNMTFNGARTLSITSGTVTAKQVTASNLGGIAIEAAVGDLQCTGGNITALAGFVRSATYFRTASNKRAAVGNTNPGGNEMLAIIRGRITSTGATSLGEGFTCTRTNTGEYTFTWSSTLASAPIFTANTNAVGIGVAISSTSTTGAVVYTYDTSTDVLTNSGLEFIAIGTAN